jgi:hypothetical protein
VELIRKTLPETFHFFDYNFFRSNEEKCNYITVTFGWQNMTRGFYSKFNNDFCEKDIDIGQIFLT